MIETDRVIGAHGLPRHYDDLQGELFVSDIVASRIIVVDTKYDFYQFWMDALGGNAPKETLHEPAATAGREEEDIRFIVGAQNF